MTPRTATFNWDSGNIEHIALHNVSPQETIEAILDQHCLLLRDYVRNGELRYDIVGETVAGRLLFMVILIRRGAIRPVTAYTAPRKFAAEYRKAKENAR